MTNLIRNMCALAALPTSISDRIEIMPLGEFRLADQRGKLAMQVIDPAQVIAQSIAAAPGGVLPIDFDHRTFAEQGAADSRAAGWITAMEVEGDRIMASVEWTPEGRKALEDRSYRFVSPVFKNLPNGQVVMIEGAGLVNAPAIPALRQLASKEVSSMDPIIQIAGILGLAADKPDDIVARVTALATAETQLASILSTAGVTAGADAVRQVCGKLTATAPDPGQFVPKASFDQLQTQFASLQKTVNDGQVEAALERARDAGKLTPDMEDWATQLASKDLGEFEAWATVAPVRIELGQRKLAGRQPPAPRADQLDPVERQVASMMGISDADFLATRNAAVKGG